MHELLDEIPPGWNKKQRPNKGARRFIYARIHAIIGGPEFTLSVFRERDQWGAQGFHQASAPRSERWPTPYTAMAAVDDWLDEHGSEPPGS